MGWVTHRFTVRGPTAKTTPPANARGRFVSTVETMTQQLALSMRDPLTGPPAAGTVVAMPSRHAGAGRDRCRTPDGTTFPDVLASIDGASFVHVWMSPGLASPTPGAEMVVERLRGPLPSFTALTGTSWKPFAAGDGYWFEMTQAEMDRGDLSAERVARLYLSGGWSAVEALARTHQLQPFSASLDVLETAQRHSSPATTAGDRAAEGQA